jgi:hypothetical protein
VSPGVEIRPLHTRAKAGVSKLSIVVLVIVATASLTSSYYIYRRYRDNHTLGLQNSPLVVSDAANSTDPQALLAEANHLYWLNNGPKAAPFFAKAETLFGAQGDARNELYARVGHLRSEAETMSFVELSRILDEQIHKPIVQNDPRLRLWCLLAKGYTDIEIDYRASKRDWL